jgi:hypothetical protein
MSLYEDQLRAATRFEKWLTSSNETFAGLWASAGYGKSYTAKHLVEEVILKNSNYIPILTSMTHSAVDVLAEFTGMNVSTLHSLMGWVPQINKETGEDYISTPQMRAGNKIIDNKINKNNIILIDEAGMVGHEEMRLLREECELTGARVLFIGDHKQCFPVTKEDEELCVPAHRATECMLELIEPKRTDRNNTIFKLSEKYRATVDGGPQPRLSTKLNVDGKTGVRYVDDIEEMAYKAFTAGIRDGNTSNIKVLAFTNKRCLSLNRKIRKHILGHRSQIPTVGEIMIANTAITNLSGEVMIRNNQKLVVAAVEETESYGMKGAFISYKDTEGEDIEETVFVPESPGKLADRLKKMSNEASGYKANGFKEEASALWRAFYSLKEGCADIRYTYAMTVNKAQGVTLKHALIDMSDINIASSFNREMAARLAYTAVSRGTTFVTIEGDLT